MYVRNSRGDPLRERDGVLRHRECVSGVHRNADVRPSLLSKHHQFVAAQVLMVLDRDLEAGSGSFPRFAAQRRARMIHHLPPSRTLFRPGALEHWREMHADDSASDCAGGTNRLVQRFSGDVPQPVAAQARHVGQLRAKSCQLVVAHRLQPASVELQAAGAHVVRNPDEAVQTGTAWIRTRGAETRKANGRGESVWVQANLKHTISFQLPASSYQLAALNRSRALHDPGWTRWKH